MEYSDLLLIVPYGIETSEFVRFHHIILPTFNRTLWN